MSCNGASARAVRLNSKLQMTLQFAPRVGNSFIPHYRYYRIRRLYVIIQ